MGIGWVLNPVGLTVLIKKRRHRNRHTQREHGHAKTEAEVEVMWPPAKEPPPPGPPEAGRAEERSFSRAFRGSTALLTPESGILASRTARA